MYERHNFFSYFFFFSAAVSAQSFHIKGRLTNEKQLPVEYANVMLFDASDTTRMVKAVTSNVKGHFELRKIPQGSYILRSSCVGYVSSSVRINNLQEDMNDFHLVMHEHTVALSEATVTAQRTVLEFDRQIIYPGKREKDTSIDGVDLVDKLNLNGILVNKVTGEISGIRGGAVKLRVNGGPASLTDLKQMEPKLVRRVEFHDMPSMRYGTVEAVIDIYVKQREFGGSGRVDLAHSAKTPQGNGMANLRLYNKRSEFSLWGNGSYYHPDDKGYLYMDKTYHFEDGSTRFRRHSSYFKGERIRQNSYAGGMGYSYLNPDDVLFTAKYSYRQALVDMPQHGFVDESGKPQSQMDFTEGGVNKTQRLGLYFQKNLKRKQFVAFEVAGSYNHTNSYYSYFEKQNEQVLSDIFSDVSGDTYSLVSEGIYEKRFNRNKLSAGINYRMNYVDNDYAGNTVYRSKFHSHIAYGYAEWMGAVGHFDYSLAARGTFNRVSNEVKTLSKNLGATWRLGYRPNKYFQLRYLGQTYVTVPSLRTLNKVDQIVDDYEIRRGNPNLKNTTVYTNTLTLNHVLNGAVSYYLSANDVYSVHPPVSVIYRENDKFVTQTLNGKYYHQLNFSGNVRLSFWDGKLRLGGLVGYKTLKERANVQTRTFDSWYGNASFDWNFYKRSSVNCRVSKNAATYSYESLTYTNWNLTCGLVHNWKDWSFSATASFILGKDPYMYRQEGQNPYYKKDLYQYIPNAKTKIMLRVARNFQFGVKRKSVNQRIENKAGESAVF